MRGVSEGGGARINQLTLNDVISDSILLLFLFISDSILSLTF